MAIAYIFLAFRLQESKPKDLLCIACDVVSSTRIQGHVTSLRRAKLRCTAPWFTVRTDLPQVRGKWQWSFAHLQTSENFCDHGSCVATAPAANLGMLSNLLVGPPSEIFWLVLLVLENTHLGCEAVAMSPVEKKNNHCAEDQDVKRSNFHPFRHPCSLELFFSIISKHSACPIHQHQNTTLQKDPWMDNLCGSSKSLPLTWGSRGQWTRDPLQVDLSFGSRAGRKGRQQHRPRNRLFFDVRGRQE